MKKYLTYSIALVVSFFYAKSSCAQNGGLGNAIFGIENDTIQHNQTPRPHDTLLRKIQEEKIKKNVNQKVKEGDYLFQNRLFYDFYATATAFSYHNDEQRKKQEPNNLHFYYNATLNNDFKTPYFKIQTRIFNELGYRKYFDSTGVKNEDILRVNNSLQIPTKHKKIKITGSMNIKTQLHKGYKYKMDRTADTLIQTLYTDYNSPGYSIYSLGLSYKLWKYARAEIGIAAGKTTRIRNQELFESRNKEVLYGVEKGESKKISYGVHGLFNAPVRKIKKNIYWQNSTKFFCDRKDLRFLNRYEFEITNAFHFVFLDHLRFTWRMGAQYDRTISKKVYLSNQYSIGFYLSNRVK